MGVHGLGTVRGTPGRCRRCNRMVKERWSMNLMFYLPVYCMACCALDDTTWRKAGQDNLFLRECID